MASKYSGLSKNTYYKNKDHYDITAAVAAVAAVKSSITTIEQEIQQLSMERPTYGSRRLAAVLTNILGIYVNRKRVQRIFRKMYGLCCVAQLPNANTFS